MPPNQFWYCTVTMMIFFTASLCSTLFIMSMTFDRFYSIIKPHKAASFNTVKRAKVSIVCIVIFSMVFDIPHFFLTSYDGPLCLPFGDAIAMAEWYSQFYYWFSFVIQFAFPFVLLLAMNSVIIHTLRTRLKFRKGEWNSPKVRKWSWKIEKHWISNLRNFAFSHVCISHPSDTWIHIFHYEFSNWFHGFSRNLRGFYTLFKCCAETCLHQSRH